MITYVALAYGPLSNPQAGCLASACVFGIVQRVGESVDRARGTYLLFQVAVRPCSWALLLWKEETKCCYCVLLLRETAAGSCEFWATCCCVALAVLCTDAEAATMLLKAWATEDFAAGPHGYCATPGMSILKRWRPRALILRYYFRMCCCCPKRNCSWAVIWAMSVISAGEICKDHVWNYCYSFLHFQLSNCYRVL